MKSVLNSSLLPLYAVRRRFFIKRNLEIGKSTRPNRTSCTQSETSEKLIQIIGVFLAFEDSKRKTEKNSYPTLTKVPGSQLSLIKGLSYPKSRLSRVSLIQSLTYPGFQLTKISLIQGLAYPRYRLSRVSLIQGLTYPGFQLSKISLIKGLTYPGSRLSWVSLIQGLAFKERKLY